jgi:hypothetical protein
MTSPIDETMNGLEERINTSLEKAIAVDLREITEGKESTFYIAELTQKIKALITQETAKAYEKGVWDGRVNPTRVQDMTTEQFREYRKLAKRRERAKKVKEQ